MGKIRLTVLLLLCTLGTWCFAQDDQQVPVGDSIDITSTLTAQPAGAVDPMMAAGSGYITSTTLQYVDNHKNCQTASGRNCWTATTPGVITQPSVGLDGFYLGIGSDGAVYHLPFADTNRVQQGWVKYAGLGSPKQIAVANATEVYSVWNTTGCAQGGYRVYQATSTLSGWALKGTRCLTHISAFPGGYVAGDLFGNAMYSSDGGSTFTAIPGIWDHIVITGKATAYAVKRADGGVYALTLNGASTTSVRLGGATTTEVTAGPNDLWIKDSNGTWYLDTTQTTRTWLHLVGPYTKFAGAGPFVFAVNASGQPFHFNAITPMITANTSGSYNCNALPNGCPFGSSHTATATVQFSDGGLSGVARSASATGCPACYLSTSIFDVDFMCDVMYGVPSGAPLCRFQPSGAVICSVMGAIMRTTFSGLLSGLAYSGEVTYKTAAQFQPGNGYSGDNIDQRGEYAICEEVPWCSNTVTPVGFQPITKDYVLKTACAPFYQCSALWLRVPGMSPVVYDRECAPTNNSSLAVCATTLP